MLDIIEKIHLGHFTYLPKKLQFTLKKIDELTLIYCGLGSSMFNIVFGELKESTFEKVMNIIDVFRGQPFAWWIPPSKKNPHLVNILLEIGFVKESHEEAMICDLKKFHGFNCLSDLSIEQVKNNSLLDDFISILEHYDSSAKIFYHQLTGDFETFSEKLFVGKVKNKPVSIGILYSGNSASGIFGLITQEENRYKGYGTYMMKHLLDFAKQQGSKYVTLSASNDSGYRIYERLGFKSLGAFECLEYKKSFV